MFDQLDRYRFPTRMAPIKDGKSRDAEHGRLMEAVLDRDVDTASRLIDAHLRKTAEGAV